MNKTEELNKILDGVYDRTMTEVEAFNKIQAMFSDRDNLWRERIEAIRNHEIMKGYKEWKKDRSDDDATDFIDEYLRVSIYSLFDRIDTLLQEGKDT